MSSQAKMMAPFPTTAELRPYTSGLSQGATANETVNAMFSTSTSFNAQAFKVNNLKYHLIRQLLEQKPLEEIKCIRQELLVQQENSKLKEEPTSSSLSQTAYHSHK